MESYYEPKSFWQAMSEYAALKQKSLMYFKAVGIQASSDQQKIDEVVKHYKKICPEEVVDCLLSQKHNVLFFEDEIAARERAQEWFPFINEMDYEEYNVYVHIFTSNGDSCFENFPFVKYD